MSANNLSSKSSTNTGKPWGLRGREAEIAEMRDKKKLSFEHIAVLMRASKQGVIGAYKRFHKTGPVPDTNTTPNQVIEVIPTPQFEDTSAKLGDTGS